MAVPCATSSSPRFDYYFLRHFGSGFLRTTNTGWLNLNIPDQTTRRKTKHQSSSFLGATQSIPNPPHEDLHSLFIADLDPSTAKLAIGLLGPFLSAFSFLFVIRIVMSWYPKLPVGKFPYVLAYAPTEPFLGITRKVIPPVGGVDVTPVVWFALVSFLSEILVGPQGLLVLLSQKV